MINSNHNTSSCLLLLLEGGDGNFQTDSKNLYGKGKDQEQKR
jgi:hypothetical protein